MNLYNYTAGEPQFDLHLKETTKSWLRYNIKFPVAKPTRHKENNIGYGEFFKPSSKIDYPLAILIHGWGDRSVIPCNLLAKSLVKKGIACFVLYLVFHSSRMPEEIRRKGLQLSPEDWLKGYQTSVIDVRQIVDWASTMKEINVQQVSVIGISLGGSISAISMGLDERISAGVFLVTGGNYENQAWKKKLDSNEVKKYQEAQNLYYQYLAEITEKGFDNVTPSKKGYLTDPMTFASFLKRRHVMMINALWDERVPKATTLNFWEACGKPEIKWFPTSHSSIWLFYPFIRKQIIEFLRSTIIE